MKKIAFISWGFSILWFLIGCVLFTLYSVSSSQAVALPFPNWYWALSPIIFFTLATIRRPPEKPKSISWFITAVWVVLATVLQIIFLFTGKNIELFVQLFLYMIATPFVAVIVWLLKK